MIAGLDMTYILNGGYNYSTPCELSSVLNSLDNSSVKSLPTPCHGNSDIEPLMWLQSRENDALTKKMKRLFFGVKKYDFREPI